MIRGARAALAAAALTAACVSERPGPVDPDFGADCVVPVGLGGALVPISDFRFIPDTIRVPAGSRVAWVNCDAAPIEPHTATADDGGWDSGLLAQPVGAAAGGSFARAFEEPGAFGYHCATHPFMTGVVLVE
ncbi:MAG TPA: plastocyanin/azurin family copper-binding protein [Longimicrobiales bacterium]|nr:plastocyanin/azurin family copper-binding protein [Longimicrobiales bacterium]